MADTAIFFPETWQGWCFLEEYLCDSAGNRYLPDDLKQSFYGRQLYQALVGTQGELRTLKRELEERVISAGSIVVEVRRERSADDFDVLQVVRWPPS